MDPAQIPESFLNGKASKGFVLAWFLVFSVINTGITYGPSWITVFKNTKPDPPTKAFASDTHGPSPTPTPENNDQTCTYYAPIDKYNIQPKYQYLSLSNEYYIPTGSGKSWEGTIWLQKIISPKFKKIHIEYNVIASSNQQNKPPAIILSLSKDSTKKESIPILKIWTPEFSESNNVKYLQILRVAKNDNSDNGLKDEQGRELSDSAKRNQTDNLTISSSNTNGNEMTINGIYSYMSDRTNTAMNFPFSTQVKFPFSDIEQSSEKLDLGIGTYKGNKFKIVSLEVCN